MNKYAISFCRVKLPTIFFLQALRIKQFFFSFINTRNQQNNILPLFLEPRHSIHQLIFQSTCSKLAFRRFKTRFLTQTIIIFSQLLSTQAINNIIVNMFPSLDALSLYSIFCNLQLYIASQGYYCRTKDPIFKSSTPLN